MIYTGCGSRQTPQDVFTLMQDIGMACAMQGHTLRSGGAIGADSAFETGCRAQHGKMQIFLADAYFTEVDIFLRQRHFYDPNSLARAEEIASKIHPAWNRCNEYARKLHTRNIFQVLGLDLQTPSDFVVYWTVDPVPFGGTRTAVVLAQQRKIRTYNLVEQKNFDLFSNRIKQLEAASH